MSGRRGKSSTIFGAFRFFEAMALLCLIVAPAQAGVTVSGGCDLKFINQQTNPSYREVFESQVKDKLSDKAITWTSCYRDNAQQLAICREKCPGHADSCPGTCAPAGQSNHQKVSTADVGGIPGDVKAGCEFLYGVCQAMRAQDQNLACEIGGYGPGGHHLAVGKGIKNTAYNQCAYLKPKMGATPSNTDGLKKEGDDLMNSIMKAAPAAAQAAQAMNQANQGSGDPAASPSSLTGNGATSPTPDSNGSGASSRNDGSGSGSGSGKGSSDQVTTGRFIATLPDGKTPGAQAAGPSGGGNSPSDITHTSASRIGSGGLGATGGAPGGGNSTGASSGGGGGGGGASASRGGSPGGGDKAQDAPTGADAELLASFAGGNKFNGGGGGKGSASSSMPDGDSVVKNAITEASQQNENPAAQAADGIGAEEGETIFARVHAAYTRCALGGTITTK